MKCYRAVVNATLTALLPRCHHERHPAFSRSACYCGGEALCACARVGLRSEALGKFRDSAADGLVPSESACAAVASKLAAIEAGGRCSSLCGGQR